MTQLRAKQKDIEMVQRIIDDIYGVIKIPLSRKLKRIIKKENEKKARIR
tara:strand:- start:937 stop:1083 length:147 start_codon:yes stop_codon:yes gene_type:complete